LVKIWIVHNKLIGKNKQNSGEKPTTLRAPTPWPWRSTSVRHKASSSSSSCRPQVSHFLLYSPTSETTTSTSLAKLKATSHVQSHPHHNLHVHRWVSNHVNLKRRSDHHNNQIYVLLLGKKKKVHLICFGTSNKFVKTISDLELSSCHFTIYLLTYKDIR
jgi:hypothetical protein